MSKVSLHEPANALWIPADQFAQGGITGGETRQFGTVRDAVRFIMEDVRNADRATAWIATDSGSLQLDEIEKIYSTLGDEE